MIKMGILDFLFSSSTQSAGRDFIKQVNKTHVEYGTRHVVATTGGFRLFDVNAEGAGGVSNGSGFTGFGWMSDILLMLAAIAVTAWAYHRYAKKKQSKSRLSTEPGGRWRRPLPGTRTSAWKCEV